MNKGKSRMKKIALILSLLTVLLNPVMLLTQTHKETKAEVPELGAFHEVIFKLWHDAWPNKNIALMKELVPAIDSNVVKIQKVQLPGILRDKKSRWDDNVHLLDTIVADFKTATTANDTQKSLDAAEKLHAQYEKLVRTIRPAMKEMDEFHQVLYPLYHYHMPDYNKEKIKSSLKPLQAAMKMLDEASLPDRLKDKVKTFNSKRIQLGKAVKYVVKVVNEIDDEKTVKDAIKEMHTKYQALEKVFD
jgi:hypothetical protein